MWERRQPRLENANLDLRLRPFAELGMELGILRGRFDEHALAVGYGPPRIDREIPARVRTVAKQRRAVETAITREQARPISAGPICLLERAAGFLFDDEFPNDVNHCLFVFCDFAVTISELLR